MRSLGFCTDHPSSQNNDGNRKPTNHVVYIHMQSMAIGTFRGPYYCGIVVNWLSLWSRTRRRCHNQEQHVDHEGRFVKPRAVKPLARYIEALLRTRTGACFFSCNGYIHQSKKHEYFCKKILLVVTVVERCNDVDDGFKNA